MALRELGATHRRAHQNLEDVGLLTVGYYGLDQCAGASGFWADLPRMAELESDMRYDLLLGLLDILRKRLAIRHEAILEPSSSTTTSSPSWTKAPMSTTTPCMSPSATATQRKRATATPSIA